MWRACAMAAIAVFVCIPLAAGADTAPRPNPDVAAPIETLAYGVYCGGPPSELREAPGTAMGVVNMVERPEISRVTTIVPAALGIGFGVLVTPVPGAISGPVEIIITHPPYPDSGIEVETWNTDFDGPGPHLVGFSFEARFELVTGPWTMEALQEGERLFHITFEVVPAAMMPDLAHSCGGAVLS